MSKKDPGYHWGMCSWKSTPDHSDSYSVWIWIQSFLWSLWLWSGNSASRTYYSTVAPEEHVHTFYSHGPCFFLAYFVVLPFMFLFEVLHSTAVAQKYFYQVGFKEHKTLLEKVKVVYGAIPFSNFFSRFRCSLSQFIGFCIQSDQETEEYLSEHILSALPLSCVLSFSSHALQYPYLKVKCVELSGILCNRLGRNEIQYPNVCPFL